MKQFFLTLFSTLCMIAPGQSFTFPADSVFYHPSMGAYHKTINSPTSSADQSTLIQSAIDAVNTNGGGILTIAATEGKHVYTIDKGVIIKSNVHIRVRPDVVFTTRKNAKSTLFTAGKTGNSRITNFSFSCSEEGKYFTFDFSNRLAGEKDGGAIAINIGAVDNFRIAGFKVRDNWTPYSCVTVNVLDFKENGQTKYLFAQNGIIENLDTYTGHYGYGTVQCQAAFKVLFRNLNGEGGAALRLETGAIGKANLADRRVRIDSVYAENIACRNGQSAITLSPHTVNNGAIFIDKVRAESCECGAVIAAGFLSAKKGQKDEAGNPKDGYVYGVFKKESIISNLQVVYGTNAQLRPVRRIFVPCAQKHLIALDKNPDQESYKGPTVAGLVYYAKDGTDPNLGYYSVNTPNMTMEQFPITQGKMEFREYVTSIQKHGFSDCTDTATPTNKKSGKVRVKRSSRRVMVDSLPGSQITLYDITGRRIKDISKTKGTVTTIDLASVHGNLFVLSITNDGNVYSKKIIL